MFDTNRFAGSPQRARLAFRAVNRRDRPGFDPGLQRHHILPRQLLSTSPFRALFAALGRDRLDFDDFRANGLLLPANDDAALRMALPLHRGPHRAYNQMAIERVGQVEQAWSRQRLKAPEIALREAYHGLALLQQALRAELLDQRRRLTLNRHDPLGQGLDFTELDAMADWLWGATAPDRD